MNSQSAQVKIPAVPETKPLQVLVVDINIGFSQSGSMFSSRVGALVEPMSDFMRHLPVGSRVMLLSDCHERHDPELCRFPWHCGRGTGEELVRPELITACEETGLVHEIVYKSEHEAFAGGRGFCLDEENKDWIVIGCVTDICVESNVAALVMRGQKVTVVRNLIDTYDLSLDACREAGLPDSSAHDADAINGFWFDHRFPAVWGTEVVQDWKEITG